MDLVWSGVLDNLGAQVGTLDCAQILLVGFCIACIFVEHIRHAGLRLSGNDHLPQLPSRKCLATLSFRFVTFIQALKVLAMNVFQS